MIPLSDVASMCLLLVTVVACTIALAFTMISIKKNRNNHYAEQEQIYRMSKERQYYEEMLHRIQSELMENEKRWEDINHLIVSGQYSHPIEATESRKYSMTSFFDNLGIDLTSIEIEKKSVFVLTPFLNEEMETFSVIKHVCGEVDLKCIRGDEVFREKDILTHIITSILQSNIVIANINGRNPNVFYELGICHAIGKPVILISKVKSDLPFDIKGKNIIFYDDFDELQRSLRNELLKVFIG